MGNNQTQVKSNKLTPRKKHKVKVKPFIDVFNGTIKLDPNGGRNPKGIIWNKQYRIRIVEARKFYGFKEKTGTVLSRVTNYVLGVAHLKEDTKLIQLLDRTIDKKLQRHAIITKTEGRYTDLGTDYNDTVRFGLTGKQCYITDSDSEYPGLYDLGKDKLPTLYKRGNVPKDYDESTFNIHDIWPGQRFVMMWADKPIVFDESPWEGDLLDCSKLWVGFTYGGSGDLILAGAHTQFGAMINVGDILENNPSLRFAGLAMHGWKFGPGLGASAGGSICIFLNYDSYPDQDSYGDFTFDWDLALSVKVPKGSLKYVKLLFNTLISLKGISKFAKPGTKTGKTIKYLSEAIIKNTLGNVDKNKKYEILLPVPVGPGLHVFIGVKTTKISSFKETYFASKLEE